MFLTSFTPDALPGSTEGWQEVVLPGQCHFNLLFQQLSLARGSFTYSLQMVGPQKVYRPSSMGLGRQILSTNMKLRKKYYVSCMIKFIQAVKTKGMKPWPFHCIYECHAYTAITLCLFSFVCFNSFARRRLLSISHNLIKQYNDTNTIQIQT